MKGQFETDWKSFFRVLWCRNRLPWVLKPLIRTVRQNLDFDDVIGLTKNFFGKKSIFLYVFRCNLKRWFQKRIASRYDFERIKSYLSFIKCKIRLDLFFIINDKKKTSYRVGIRLLQILFFRTFFVLSKFLSFLHCEYPCTQFR